MPIPELDAEGRLPDGVHDCTLDEIEERFGKIKHTDHRVRLFSALRDYVGAARQSGIVHELYVNGSFVTGKIEPGDIDLIVVLPLDYDTGKIARPIEYNVRSRRMLNKLYRDSLDVLVARSGSGALAEYQGFFHQVRSTPGARKGYLRVEL